MYIVTIRARLQSVTDSGKTKDAFLDMCIRQLAMLCALHNIDLRLQHVRGIDNAMADSLSRGKYNNLGEVQWDIVPHHLLAVF